MGNDGSNRRAFDSHGKAVNENGIEDDIRDGADQYGKHTDERKALRGDKGVQAERQLHKNGTQCIYAHIFDGIIYRILCRSERPKQLFRKYDKNHGKNRPYGGCDDRTVAEYSFRLLFIPLSHHNRSASGSANRRQIGKGGNNHDERKAHPHRRQGIGPRIGHMSDIYSIHDIIQGIDELCRNRGNRKFEKQFSDGLCAEFRAARLSP